MSSYYDRRFSLELDEIPFIAETGGRQFRVSFTILVDFGGYTSYADIRVYGLSRDTEDKVFKIGQKVAFRCGYADNIDYIFKGDLVNLLHEKQGPDRITRLVCRSGAVTRDTTSLLRTLGAGSALPAIIKSCTDAMGLPLVINEEDFSSTPKYSRGYVISGSPDEALKKLAKTHNFNYVIENDRVVVTGTDSFRAGNVHQISQFTGMVGAPEITENGADVVIKLNPKIKIFGRFEITSEYKTFNFNNIYFQNVQPSDGLGVYRIFRIEHSGDSYGDEWDTKITGIR